MKQSDKVPLWNPGIQLSLFIYLFSLFFLNEEVGFLVKNWILGVIIATVLFVVSLTFGVTAVLSRRRQERQMEAAKEPSQQTTA